MNYMTVGQLYDKLCSDDFKRVSAEYNYYMYLYPAAKEHQMQEQIEDIKNKILRPANNVDILTIDLFEAFCEYLDNQSFGRRHPSYLKYIYEKDAKDNMHDNVTESLLGKAASDEFTSFVHEKISSHIAKSDEKHIRPYVFIHGIGKIYPYLRANNFLVRYEKFNKVNHYKLIIFYPGEQYENTFRLFGKLEDDHAYRANLLINEM